MDKRRLRAYLLVWLLVASGLLGLLTFTDTLDRPASAAYLWNWDHRKSHVINPQAGAGTGYVIYLDVHSGAGADSGKDVYLDSECDNFPQDIRFTSSDGSTVLNHWAEDLALDPVRFYIKMSEDLSSVARTIYIYYGSSNMSLSNPATGTSVFTLNHNFTADDGSYSGWGAGTSFTKRIGLKTTTKYAGNPVFTAASSYCTANINRICVIRESATSWKMWYSGEQSVNFVICYATSTDGITWTDYVSNPILTKTGAGWEMSGVKDPWVVKYAGSYYMMYAGYDATYTKIGWATSLDGIAWSRFASNPIITVGSGGSFNEKAMEAPSFIWDPYVVPVGWKILCQARNNAGITMPAHGSSQLLPASVTMATMSAATETFENGNWGYPTISRFNSYGAYYFTWTGDTSASEETGYGRGISAGPTIFKSIDKVATVGAGGTWDATSVGRTCPVWMGYGEGWRVYYSGYKAGSPRDVGFYTQKFDDYQLWNEPSSANDYSKPFTNTGSYGSGYIFEASVKMTGGAGANRSIGIIAKAQGSPSPYYLAAIYPNSGNFILHRKWGTASYYSLGSYAAGAAHDTVYRIGIGCVDEDIYTYLDDVMRITASDPWAVSGLAVGRTSLCTGYIMYGLRVRPFVYPEPTHGAYGAEEDLLTPIIDIGLDRNCNERDILTFTAVTTLGPVLTYSWWGNYTMDGTNHWSDTGQTVTFDSNGRSWHEYKIECTAQGPHGWVSMNFTMTVYPHLPSINFMYPLLAAIQGDHVDLYQPTIDSVTCNYNWSVKNATGAEVFNSTDEYANWDTYGFNATGYRVYLGIDDMAGRRAYEYYDLLVFPSTGGIWFYNWSNYSFTNITNLLFDNDTWLNNTYLNQSLFNYTYWNSSYSNFTNWTHYYYNLTFWNNTYRNSSYRGGGTNTGSTGFDEEYSTRFEEWTHWFEARFPNPLISDEGSGGGSIAIHLIWIGMVGAACGLLGFALYYYGVKWWHHRTVKRGPPG